MKRYLPFVIIAVVGLLALGSGGMLYRAKRAKTSIVPKVMSVTNDRAKEVHVRGPADAAVTLEEFGDFQCPPCGRLAGPILEIEEENHSRLRVIFYHFPLAIHQHALEAAFAARSVRFTRPLLGNARPPLSRTVQLEQSAGRAHIV